MIKSQVLTSNLKPLIGKTIVIKNEFTRKSFKGILKFHRENNYTIYHIRDFKTRDIIEFELNQVKVITDQTIKLRNIYD